MSLDDPSGWVNKPVRDIYGRNLGRSVGYTVDPSGKVIAFGVDHGLTFVEYPADRVVTAEKAGITILPAWKAESKRVGIEKGALEKKVGSLSTLLERGEISRKIYEEKMGSILEAKEQLTPTLLKRLEEIEAEGDRIESFLANVKLHGLSQEIGEVTVRKIAEYCDTMTSMNEREKTEITELLEMVEKELRVMGEKEAIEEGEDERRPDRESQEGFEEVTADDQGGISSLRSLRTRGT